MQILLAIFPYLIGVALAAVLATLFVGALSMARGGEFNRKYGNKLMRLRVGLQAITVVLFIVYVLLTRT